MAFKTDKPTGAVLSVKLLLGIKYDRKEGEVRLVGSLTSSGRSVRSVQGPPACGCEAAFINEGKCNSSTL